MTRPMRVALLSGLAVVAAGASGARAAPRHVPQSYRTIQAAVDAARPGDTIEVAPGQYCGATLDRAVHLVGHGQPVIVGCADGPALPRGERIGFFLPGTAGDNPASGSSIEGFVFEGRGL